MSSCGLWLENYEVHYASTNTIVGRVICVFNTPKSIREIRVKLRGEEYNEWSKSESYTDSDGKSRTRSVTYSGNNRFYGVHMTLMGGGELEAGSHDFPFSITLPKGLPGSFIGRHGYIRYRMKAVVERPSKSDYRSETEIRVLSLVDLNEIRDRLQLTPIAYSEDQTICCCCASNSLITMNLHMPKGWFVAGETARIRVHITNQSNQNVVEVHMKLVMMIESKVTFPRTDTTTDTELIANVVDTGVGAHGERDYDFNLVIPQFTSIPNFTSCTLFRRWSVLKATAVLPGCHGKLKIHTPVELGQIPVSLQDNGIFCVSQPAVAPGPSAPPIEIASELKRDESLPPPYEEAVPHANKY